MLSALLERVGYAVWQSAECEDTLAHWVLVALRPTRGIGEDEATPIIERVQNKTFGGLLSELKQDRILEEGLVERLEKLRDERNWLVHHAKRQNRGVLNRMQQFDELIERITWIGEEATELNTILGKQFEEHVVDAGVDRALIDEEAARLVDSWSLG